MEFILGERLRVEGGKKIGRLRIRRQRRGKKEKGDSREEKQ